LSRACFLVLLLLPIIMLAVPTVHSEAVQYNIVGTTVDVSVANVKFKVLGTGCIVNLTINDELFLLYSGYAFWPDAMNGLSYYSVEYSVRFLRVDVPKVKAFTNGIIIRTYAKLRDPQVHVYGTFTVYNTGVIVVNITYVAWNTTTLWWPGVRNLYPYPQFNGLKCLIITSEGLTLTLPHDINQGSSWGSGWVCIAMPSPATPNTYLVTITLLPSAYATTQLRSYSDIGNPPWYTQSYIFSHVIREYGESWSGGPGDSITWLYILYPHTKGEEFTKELLTIGWKLDGTIRSLKTTSVQVKLPTTRRILENIQKNIKVLIDKLGTGDIATASSLAESIYDKAKNLWLTESYHELVYFVLVPSAIVFGIMILVSIRAIKRT